MLGDEEPDERECHERTQIGFGGVERRQREPLQCRVRVVRTGEMKAIALDEGGQIGRRRQARAEEHGKCSFEMHRRGLGRGDDPDLATIGVDHGALRHDRPRIGVGERVDQTDVRHDPPSLGSEALEALPRLLQLSCRPGGDGGAEGALPIVELGDPLDRAGFEQSECRPGRYHLLVIGVGRLGRRPVRRGGDQIGPDRGGQIGGRQPRNPDNENRGPEPDDISLVDCHLLPNRAVVDQGAIRASEVSQSKVAIANVQKNMASGDLRVMQDDIRISPAEDSGTVDRDRGDLAIRSGHLDLRNRLPRDRLGLVIRNLVPQDLRQRDEPAELRTFDGWARPLVDHHRRKARCAPNRRSPR